MIRPNPNVAAMAPYLLPDITSGSDEGPIVLAQNEHAWPPSALMYACLRRFELDVGRIAAGGYLFTRRN